MSKKEAAERSKSSLSAPSRQTVKRLFAISGNRCAFSPCTTPIVDGPSGSILGEICHIKGEKPKAKRYDRTQTSGERHAFENLILLCPAHHKIIDDDDCTYTVEALHEMKRKHERKQRTPRTLDNYALDGLLKKLKSVTVVRGSAIRATNQSGGQIAHSIKNVYNTPATTHAPVHVEGKIGPLGDLKVLKRFGSAGIELTVVNRGDRPAKIAKAQFCVEGKGFLAALERGFGRDLQHDPPPGLEREVLSVDLFPRAKKHCREGFVLQRDDVCRFFLPFGPWIGPAFEAKANDMYFRIEYFDESKEILTRGTGTKRLIRDCFNAYKEWPHNRLRGFVFRVEVASKTLPRVDFASIGSTNPMPVHFGKSSAKRGTPKRLEVEVRIGIATCDGEKTIAAGIGPLPPQAIHNLQADYCVADEATQRVYVLKLPRVASSKATTEATFILPIAQRDKAIAAACKFASHQIWLRIYSNDTEVVRIHGDELKQAFRMIETHLTPPKKDADPDSSTDQ